MKQAGFTLIEILVVITIVGIIAGIAGYSISGMDSRRLEGEAAKLALVFNQLADRATMKKELIRWYHDRENGRCHARHFDSRENKWRPLSPATRYNCNAGAFDKLELHTESDTSIDSEGDRDLDKDSESLLFFPAGYYTGFTLNMASNGHSVTVAGDGLNAARLESRVP